MAETKEQSQLEYLSKRAFIPFDFSKHFEIYEKASDLFDEDKGDVFNGDKTSWLHFFSSYSELLGLLQEFGFRPTLIENSLFIVQRENPNEPEYLLVVFNQDQDMLKKYVHGVKKNVLGEKIGTKQFNPITHHKELAINPYYYKQYSSNSFANRDINIDLKNIKYCIKSYKRKPFEEKGIGELLKSIENFFDKVVSDYSALEKNSNTSGSNTCDLAILIPFPRPGTSFQRHVNLAGGCFFLFGSMDKNKSVEKLIARIRQYFIDSLLQQTLLKSSVNSSTIVKSAAGIHWIKSNLESNLIAKLNELKSDLANHKKIDGTKIDDALEYCKKFKEDMEKLLLANSFQSKETDPDNCKKIIEDCISTFSNSGIAIELSYKYDGSKIYTNLPALKIIITMLIDNAIKYMGMYWRSNEASGQKEIHININKIRHGNQNAFGVSIFNNGTMISEDIKNTLGKQFPKNLTNGSTGLGLIIVYQALKTMDAHIFPEINSYLSASNVKNGVEVSFLLRTYN